MPSDCEAWCFDTVTGRVREVLPVEALSWHTPLGSGGEVTATVRVDRGPFSKTDLRELTSGWRRSLAVVRGGTSILAAGIFNGDRPWDSDSPSTVKTTAVDVWELLARRYLLGSYQPGPLVDCTLTAASLSGLATEIVNRAVNDIPGGQLPLVLPEREPGDAHTRTWKGTDLKDAKAALDDLMKVENGPDIRFDPTLTADGSTVGWVLKVGRPLLGQPGEAIVFDLPGQGVVKAAENEDASGVATTMLVTAQPQSTDTSGEGSSEQVNLVARGDNPALLDAGYPAMWGHNGDHTDVSVQATLDAYAVSYARDAAAPTVERPLTVRADHPVHPLGSYRPGDSAQVVVARSTPWLPDGPRDLRITDIAADLGDQVTLTVAEKTGNDQ